MSNSIEELVVNSLVFNQDYTRKVIPHISADYFENYNNKVLFEEISSYLTNYDTLPTMDALRIELEGRTDLNESSFKEISTFIDGLVEEPHEENWLCDTTEKWCRDRAIYNALLESIQIAEGDHKGVW